MGKKNINNEIVYLPYKIKMDVVVMNESFETKNSYLIKRIISRIFTLSLGLCLLLIPFGNCVINGNNVSIAQRVFNETSNNLILNSTTTDGEHSSLTFFLSTFSSHLIVNTKTDVNTETDDWGVTTSNEVMNLSHTTPYFANNLINTSVNQIPWVISSLPYTITASGWSNLSNVTLYYRYSADNFTTYCTDMQLDDVFREGVDTTVFDYPNSIKIIGSVGYAIAYLDNSLVLINVTNPYTLTQLSYKVDNFYLYRVHDIAVSADGNYAYTITYTANPWICIWDVTDKSTPPIRLKRVQISSVGQGMYLNFDNTGNFLYATTTDYCYIYNITDKANSQLDIVSKFNTGIPGTSFRWHTYVLGDALYVCVNNQSSTLPGDGVYVYNISDKTHPVLVNDFNHTEQVREFREYYWHGFHYLVGFLQYKKNSYWTGALGLWNVSSGNATHPDFVRQVNTLEADGTFTSDAFDIHNGYAFAMRKNYNTTKYNGITAYSLKDINRIFKVDHINGTSFPNYLNLSHEVEFNQNGVDGTVYVVSQISDALTTISPNWGNQIDSWIRYGIDYSSPWSWSFNFPNGTGYYEFYSIGKKNGDTESSSDHADAGCFFKLNNPPYIPSNPNPANKSTDISLDVALGWIGGDPDSDDTVSYDVYFGTTILPPKVASNLSMTIYTPGALEYITTYYWKIVAWDSHGLSKSGVLWQFTTKREPNNPPYTPDNPSPANGATNVDIDTDLSWSGGDPDPGDTVTYDVYFGTTIPPQKLVSNQTSSSYQPATLIENTTYYWKIVSWDNNSTSTSGPIWNYTTINPEQFIPSFIFGRITDKYVDNKIISFDSVKTWKITFSPIHFFIFSPYERITIEKEYIGLIGTHFIFAFCKVSLS